MLAFSVREALRQAAAAFGPAGSCVELASPATPEAVWWAVEQARSGGQQPVAGAPGVEPQQPDADRPLLHPRSEHAGATPAEGD